MTPQGQRFWAQLTPRKKQLLELICASGDSYREIAQQMGIKPDGVKVRVWQMLQLAGADNRWALAVFAWRHGIFPCPCERAGEADAGGHGYGGA